MSPRRIRSSPPSEDAFRAARAAVMGERHAQRTEMPSVEVLIATGRTPAQYRALGGLAEHAIRVQSVIATMTAVWLGVPASEARAEQVARRLIALAEATAYVGALWQHVTPWLDVLASETDDTRFRGLRGALVHWGVTSSGIPVAYWSQRIGWLSGFTWAAGMTLNEAVQAKDAGDLNETTLRTMAVLRGYRLPADPLA